MTPATFTRWSDAAGFTSTSADYDQAIADYTRAIAIKPGDPRILAGRAEAHLWKKEYGPGFADGEASLAALPDQAVLQNQIAWAYAMAQPPFRDPAKAVTHARLAVRLAPENGNHHNTLGVALYRGGKYREAVTELESSLAVASKENGPYDLFFLAMCRVHLSETSRGKVDFERACRFASRSQSRRQSCRRTSVDSSRSGCSSEQTMNTRQLVERLIFGTIGDCVTQSRPERIRPLRNCPLARWQRVAQSEPRLCPIGWP